MLRSRRGSVLAMAVSLTAVFLTLILAGISYVETSTRAAKSNRYRDLADQAARSGLDFVLGWAEQNIDRESRLPNDWESLGDGGTMDPVSKVVRTQPKDKLRDCTNPGQILGTNLREYVLARSGAYVVSFKARVQQYRISDNMPRQYRIGVVGRVRHVPTGNADTNPDNDERANVVAERMILANIGREPASRYAALIDFDSVKNWVPGEVVSGPVHINRGYVDDNAYRGLNKNIKTDSLMTGVQAAAARSVMMLHTSASSAGFGSVISGGATSNTPVFEDAVSMTVIRQGDTTYTNYDVAETDVVKVNNGSEQGFTSALMGTAFRAQENQGQQPWGAAGPIIRSQPVLLPTSVRGALSAALGVPANRSIYDYRAWFNSQTPGNRLPDGVYLPTATWWGGAMSSGGNADDAPFSTTVPYAAADYPVGGIYIRGNVEVMRMGVEGHRSYYLFQLGYGSVPASGITSVARRTYGVMVNRATRQTFIRAFNSATRDEIEDLYAPCANAPTVADLFNGLDGLAGGRLGTPGMDSVIEHYKINGAGDIAHAFTAKPLPSATDPEGSEFPFNGVIFVDLSRLDPARHPTNPLAVVMGNGTVPLTGNIFALGDPGVTGTPGTKRALSGNTQETVATYRRTVGSDTRNDIASKLTIMSTGNIFIQNHLILESLKGFNLNNIGKSGNQPTISDSKDLLGLVADKQIVVGLYAPSTTTRGNNGVMIHGAIAALGDPGMNYSPVTPTVPISEITQVPRSYRGSFTTEGIMQEFSTPIREQYNVCVRSPGERYYTNTSSTEDGSNVPVGPLNNDGPQLGYPGNPIYHMYPSAVTPVSRAGNPNRGVRGNMLVFGSITQKKRGVIGVSNRSYDKDFRFDRRLLAIAPPIFPSSTNVIIRNINPFSPSDTDPNTRYPYRSGASIAGNAGDSLRFMSALP